MFTEHVAMPRLLIHTSEDQTPEIATPAIARGKLVALGNREFLACLKILKPSPGISILRDRDASTTGWLHRRRSLSPLHHPNEDYAPLSAITYLVG